MTSTAHDLELDGLQQDFQKPTASSGKKHACMEKKALSHDTKPRNYLFDLDIDLFIRPEALYSSAVESMSSMSSSKKRATITEAINRRTWFDLDMDLLINPDHLNMNPPKLSREKSVHRMFSGNMTSFSQRRDLDIDLLMTPDSFNNYHHHPYQTNKIIA